jgi:hypothetical protein
MRCWRSLAGLVLVSTLGCSPGTEPNGSSRSIAFSHEGLADISGSIFLGAGDQSICSVLSEDAPLFLFGLSLDPSLGGSSFTSCPTNSYTMSVEPGSYFVRVSLPSDQPLGMLPRRWIEPTPVTVDQEDVVKDIHVENGSAVEGRATVDGAPAEGVSLVAMYADFAGFAGNFGSSRADGTWDDGLGRSAMILQNDLDYVFSGCDAAPIPGIKTVSGVPNGVVRFPTGTNRVDCDFISGTGLRYTHQATRLKLSSYAGDIGGVSVPLLLPEVGYGYSAQFPLPPGEAPKAGPASLNRQLFRGGLVLGMGTDMALAGTELEGYVMCSVSPCRSFGFNARARVVRRGAAKEITWTYDDAGSQRPQGLRVVQRSFDGAPGRDYVLYGFRITNGGSAPVTFTPGLFLDFDVSPDASSNIGYTELDGRLMVTTNPEDEGLHFGSVILGSSPATTSYIFDPALFLSEADVVAALRGELSSSDLPFPTDVRYLHGGSAVTLKRGKSTDFWVAIVAGESRAEIIANAQAALADGNRGGSGDALAVSAGDWESVQAISAGVAGRSHRGTKLCKSGCEGDRR